MEEEVEEYRKVLVNNETSNLMNIEILKKSSMMISKTKKLRA